MQADGAEREAVEGRPANQNTDDSGLNQSQPQTDKGDYWRSVKTAADRQGEVTDFIWRQTRGGHWLYVETAADRQGEVTGSV